MPSYMPYVPPYSAPGQVSDQELGFYPAVRPSLEGLLSTLTYDAPRLASEAVAGLLVNANEIPQINVQTRQVSPTNWTPMMRQGGTGGSANPFGAAESLMGDNTLFYGPNAMFPQTGNFLNPFGNSFGNWGLSEHSSGLPYVYPG